MELCETRLSGLLTVQGNMNACLCEEHDWETGPCLIDESGELVFGGLAAWVEIEDELWVERGIWLDGGGENVVWECCDEGGERCELLCRGKVKRRTWHRHGFEAMCHLARG